MVSLPSLRHDADIPDGVSIHKHNYLLQYMYKDASWSIVDIINLILKNELTENIESATYVFSRLQFHPDVDI